MSVVKGNHPLAEIIAKNLFSIDTVPKEEMRRMVSRACKEAVRYFELEKKKYGMEVREKAYWLWKECYAEGYRIRQMDLPGYESEEVE